jgi:hypothetical protein
VKHELALIAVVAAGLGAVAVTVAVGSSVREPTVVGNPYEAGLHHAEAVAARRARAPAQPSAARACDLGASRCAKAAGDVDVTLDLAPRPLRTLSDLGAAVELRRGGAPVDGATVVLSFDMRGMTMGPNRRTLLAAGAGRYAGKAVLVRCLSGRKDWVATVAVELPGAAPVTASFDFAVAE